MLTRVSRGAQSTFSKSSFTLSRYNQVPVNITLNQYIYVTRWRAQRIKILQSVSDGKLKSSEVEAVIKIAKTSDALLDKVLETKIPVNRAIDTVNELLIKAEEKGVPFTKEQKQSLADNLEKDEAMLDKYKSTVLEKVKQAVSKPQKGPRVIEPIGRTSPVKKIITVKDEVLDHFKIYIGNCDINERKWALRILHEIKKRSGHPGGDVRTWLREVMQMSNRPFTTIRIKPETREALVELKRGRDTFDDVIRRLIEQHKA